MKTAVFGGAFDPFHVEHKRIIMEAHDYLGLDRVVVVPSFLPPHKSRLSGDYDTRKEMVLAGCRDLPYVIVDDIEKERNTVNPSCVILPILREKYGELYFIMGGDSVKNFSSWIEPQIVADTVTLAIVEREGCGDFLEDIEEVERKFNAKTVVIPYVGKKVSSSAIKASVELGEESDDLDGAVREVIDRRGLYRNFADIVERVQADIPERTFRHVASTVIYAEEYAGVNKLPFDEVFLSCLLHDCAKHLDIEMEGVPAPVVHQFTGADRAREVYGITNTRILEAIRYHTSGKKGMNSLEKLTFVADMLEPMREFDGVEELRAIMDESLDEGFVACINASYDHLLAKGRPIYPLTKECVEYYNNI